MKRGHLLIGGETEVHPVRNHDKNEFWIPKDDEINVIFFESLIPNILYLKLDFLWQTRLANIVILASYFLYIGVQHEPRRFLGEI